MRCETFLWVCVHEARDELLGITAHRLPHLVVKIVGATQDLAEHLGVVVAEEGRHACGGMGRLVSSGAGNMQYYEEDALRGMSG